MSGDASKERSLFIAPIVLVLGVMIFKAYLIAVGMVPESLGERILYLVLQDSALIGLGILLACVASLVDRLSIRSSLLVILFLLSLIYVLDTLVIITINDRLTLFNLVKFASEWKVALEFVEGPHWFLIAAIPLSFFISLKTSRRAIYTAVAFGLVLVVVGINGITSGADLQKYAFNASFFLDRATKKDPGAADRYYPREIAQFQASVGDSVPVNLPESARNVLLVIVESFSNEDSKRLLGLKDNLPRFDEITTDGILFSNFYANYSDTEGGIVAILTQQAPIPFPGGSRNLYRSFDQRGSIASTLSQRGYHTEFLTTGPLSFLGKGDYLKQIGFNVVNGRDEIDRFRAAPKFAFDSPADVVLYEEALSRIERLSTESRQFLLTLLTVTSHRPPRDPLGRGNNMRFVWDYADQALSSFYQQLRDSGFFDDGIMIVVSDHRKMFPVKDDLRKIYGAASEARVPLWIVGSGIPENVVDDRLFQQCDLFRMLERVTDSNAPLSSFAVFVERYTQYYTSTTAYGQLRVFDQEGIMYPARVRFRNFNWIDRKPENGDMIANWVHGFRALNQRLEAFAQDMWQPEFEDRAPLWQVVKAAQGNERGLLMNVFKGHEIDGRLDEDRLLSSEVVSKVEFYPLNMEDYGVNRDFALEFRGWLKTTITGDYWFRVESDDGTGLALDHRIVISANRPKGFGREDGQIHLTPGFHSVDLRYFQHRGSAAIKWWWKPPGATEWEIVPEQVLYPPRDSDELIARH